MAKMRGIKPETFTDDKILQISPLARWLFIGMWTQACDNGHVEDNPVQLKVRLLPMDNCDVKELVNELVDIGLVKRMEGHLSIPNLPHHQKIDRRFLVFCEACEFDPDVKFYPKDKLERSSSKRRASKAEGEGKDARSSGARRALVDEGEGEGEGEGETTPSSHVASDDDGQSKPEKQFPEEVHQLSQHLADWVIRNGHRKPTVGKTWLQAIDRLIRIDEYTPDQIRQVIDWSQQDEFWQGNIMSASKLRKQFDQLKTRMLQSRNRQPNQPHMTASQRRLQEGYEREQRILNGELDFTNTDNPYMQPRPQRQAIEGGNPWTPEQQ